MRKTRRRQKAGKTVSIDSLVAGSRKGPLTMAIAAAMLGSGLVACTEQWDVEGVPPVAGDTSPYMQALHAEYITLAKAERAEQDWQDTAHFVAQARRVAGGEDPGPEPLDGRNLPSGGLEELTAARQQLMTYLDAGVRDTMPEAAAGAVGGFDCWMQEQEEGHQPEDIAACRVKFNQAMAVLAQQPIAKKPTRKTLFVLLPDEDGAVGEVLVDQDGKKALLDEAYEAVEAAPDRSGLDNTFIAEDTLVTENFDAAIRAHPLTPREFTVFFDFASSAISSEAGSVLAAISEDLTKRQAAEIIIRGHADRAGSNAFNKQLSATRADTVFAAIKDKITGKDGKVVDVSLEPMGEEAPIVQTADGVPEPQNRRVEVVIR